MLATLFLLLVTLTASLCVSGCVGAHIQQHRLSREAHSGKGPSNSSTVAAHDKRCPANITVSWTDEQVILSGNTLIRGETLYLYPEKGFEGVSLVATGIGWEEKIWFPVNDSCFRNQRQWWAAHVNLPSADYGYIRDLRYTLEVGECGVQCFKTGFFPSSSFQIVAHGSSRWRFEDPKPCTTEYSLARTVQIKNCTQPPTKTKTATTPTTTSTTTRESTTASPTTSPTISKEVVAIIVLTLTTIGVTVVVVLVLRKRSQLRRNTISPQELQLEPRLGRVAATTSSHRQGVALSYDKLEVDLVPREDNYGYLIARWGRSSPSRQGGLTNEASVEDHIYEELEVVPREDDDGYLAPQQAAPGTPSVVIEK